MFVAAQPTTKKSASSSLVTRIVILGAVLLCLVVPGVFHEPPAHPAFLIIWWTATIVALIFMVVSLRRKKIVFTLVHLTWPLVAIAILTIVSTLINYPLSPIAALVGRGGLLIAACVLVVLGSQLVAVRNQKIIISILLALGVVASMAAIYAMLSIIITGQMPDLIVDYYPNLATTALSIIIPALAGMATVYLKKGKFARWYLIVLPFLVFGLAAAVLLTTKGVGGINRPSFEQSLTVIKNSLVISPEVLDGGSDLTRRTLTNSILAAAFGRGSENYTFIFSRFLKTNDFQTAWNAPFTLAPTLGLLVAGCWLWLLIAVWREVFKRGDRTNFAACALAVSMTCQLFLPFTIPVAMIQIALLMLTMQGSKSYSIYIKNDDLSRKPVVKILYYLLLLVLMFLEFLVFIRVNVTYLAYYHHEKSLQALLVRSSDQLEKYYAATERAVKLAPNIDVFNQFAAIANLEKALQDQEQPSYLATAADLATRATQLGPMRTQNWLTLSHIYQDLAVLGVDSVNASDLAARMAANAILTDPTNPNHYLLLGNIYLQQGAPQRGGAFFEEALKRLDQDDVNYVQNVKTIEDLMQQAKF